MRYIYITLFVLCMASFDYYASVAPISKKYGQWSEKIIVKKYTNPAAIEVSLFQEVSGDSTISNSPTTLSYKKIAFAECVYHSYAEIGYIEKIHVFDNPTHRRGCGTRLFKQAVAQLYQNFPCDKIDLLAYAFLNRESLEAHEYLIKFYTKLGAVVEKKLGCGGAEMLYPMHLATALEALMPLLEPTLLDEAFQNDPVTTIIQYIGPLNEYPAVPMTASAPANIPSNKADCAPIELL